MVSEDFINGLRFSWSKALSTKETEVLLHFFDGPQSVNSLLEKTSINKYTLYSLLQRLGYKNIITLDSRDSVGNTSHRVCIDD